MRVTDRLAAEVEGRLAESARGHGVPGYALALVAPGRRALVLHGEDAPGSGRPVTADTWFSVASLGKHVTAAAVLDLAQRGRLDLDEPVGARLPGLPPAWASRSVLSLLRHTAGLPEYLAHAPGDPVPEARDAFLSAYGALAPAYAEGEGWSYSNTHYIVAGFLVAQLSGDTYAGAVHGLFDGMGSAGAAVCSPAWTRAANAQRLPPGSRDAASARREVIGDGDVSFTAAGALAWLEGLLDGRLLDARHTACLYTGAPLASGRVAHYGCGWFLEPMRGRRLVHHAGHYDGWTAMALLDPDVGAGVLAMCNHAPGSTRAIRHLAVQALEAWSPGSTPLSLPVLDDEAPALTARIRAQLLRPPGQPIDPACFAEELVRVAEHGGALRPVISFHGGAEPLGFELVEAIAAPAYRLRRYRLRHADRIEHLLVGLTPDDRIYWAWGL